MPLTSSRLKKIIANAESSCDVSPEEVENLKKKLQSLQEDIFKSKKNDEGYFNDNGKEVCISTGRVDKKEIGRLKREIIFKKFFRGRHSQA